MIYLIILLEILSEFFGFVSASERQQIALTDQGSIPVFASQPEITDLTPLVSGLKNSDDWKETIHSDGVLGYKKDIPGSPICTVKGLGEVDAPYEEVAKIIIDEERAPEWIEDLIVSKPVGGNFPYDYIEFNHIGTPFILNDREFVSRVRMKVDPIHKIIAYSYSKTDFIYPVKLPHVRGVIDYSVMAVMALPESPSLKTLVLAEFHGDPKGNVPKWLVNWFQTSWPKDSLLALRKQVLKVRSGTQPK